MQALKLVKQSILTIVAALLLIAVWNDRAQACSCLPSTVESSYNQSSDVFSAEIALTLSIGSTRFFVARVLTTYKGCLEADAWVLLTTPASSASCGATLSAPRHLINGQAAGRRFGLPAYSISLCNYDVPLDAVSEHDQQFLDGRTLCCGDECSCVDGSSPVACLVDPCQVAPACEEGVCTANYCGGCNAEFYDDSGNAVCQADDECASDEDCPSGHWCRQAKRDDSGDEPNYECVPFVAEGEQCGGFRPAWLFERCESGLICDEPDFTADAPGSCRRSCAADAECYDGEYCASDGACDKQGACERPLDCNLSGNSYPHIECVGYGVCDESLACGWQCGDPQCLDLAGYDFGACDYPLGWAVQFGTCVQVSGCESAEFKLWQTQEECVRACQEPSCEDLAGVDFGDCKRALGVGIVEGACTNIGGCDTRGHALFESIEQCTAACVIECDSDADCYPTGCSGQICAATTLITTCEYEPEYACYQDPELTQCACFAGHCGWEQTQELRECIDAAQDTGS